MIAQHTDPRPATFSTAHLDGYAALLWDAFLCDVRSPRDRARVLTLATADSALAAQRETVES